MIGGRNARMPPTYDVVEGRAGAGTRFISAKVEHLYRWWAASGAPPRRAAFDVTEHWHLAPNLFLVAVRPEGGFQFRLYGEQVIKMLGVNNRGRVLAPGRPEGTGGGRDLLRYYQTIVADRACWRCVGNFGYRGREHVRFESIDCPLTGDGGAIVAIIGCMDELP